LPQNPKDSGSGSEIKKTGTTANAGSSSTDPKAAAANAKKSDSTKPEKPDVADKTAAAAKTVAAATTAASGIAASAGIKVDVGACFNTQRQLVITPEKPVVAGIKILEFIPNDTKPLGFNYGPTQKTF
jgi:hypothetical protein